MLNHLFNLDHHRKKVLSRIYDLEVEWQNSNFEEVKHIFSHRKWHVRILSGQVVDSKEYSDKEVVWLTPEEFDLYPLAKPQQKNLAAYIKR